MARKVSQKMRNSVMSEDSPYVKVILLTLSHRSLPVPIRLSSDATVRLWEESTNIIYGTVSNGLEYMYAGFQCALLNDEKDTIPQAQLTIPNVHRSIIEGIETMGSGVVSANFKLVYSDTPDIIEADITGLELTSITYDETYVTGILSRDLMFNEPFPSRTFTPQEYPFLFSTRPLG